LRSRLAAKEVQTFKVLTLAFMHKLVSLSECVKRYFQSYYTAYASAPASTGV